MTERIPAEVFPPGEFIREELEARGWNQNDLAEILGSYPRLVSEIITGKRAITPETAKKLAAAFGTSAQLWMNLESTYRLWRVRSQEGAIARRARLFERAPVKEMAKRLWIEYSQNAEVLEKALLDFFEITSIEEEPQFWSFAARTSLSYRSVTSSQRAWLFRARRLARAVSVGRFSEALLKEAMARFRQLLPNPEDTRHVPRIMAEAGVRFVVLEPLPQSRIDGACFWLDERSPVIIVSLRYDRIDGFWHTLLHECGHVLRDDGLNENAPLDTDLLGDGSEAEKPENEQEVDAFAAESLIAREELDDFITRIGPLYSKRAIKGFANRIGVHPGIVVGQLQHRREISYAHSRDLLVRVRHIITGSALTDGWGHFPSGV